MRYDDLLNVPYKAHGRGDGGYDCYGLVVEMCRRAGTPLRDPYDIAHLPAERVNDYIGGVNVRRTDEPKVGAIAEFTRGGNLHVGYIAERGKVIHATTDRGVRVTPLAAMRATAYYEVVNESDAIQDSGEQRHGN